MIRRASLVWLVIIGAEVLHGILRTVFVQPYVGDVRARQIGVLAGSLMILAIALVFARWIGARGRRELFVVGLLWLALTLAFEIGFGRLVLGYPWERLLSDYNLAEGGLLGVGMIVLTMSPWIAARIRGVEP